MAFTALSQGLSEDVSFAMSDMLFATLVIKWHACGGSTSAASATDSFGSGFDLRGREAPSLSPASEWVGAFVSPLVNILTVLSLPFCEDFS